MLIRTVNSNSGSMNGGPFLCFHSQFGHLASLLEDIFSELCFLLKYLKSLLKFILPFDSTLESLCLVNGFKGT